MTRLILAAELLLAACALPAVAGEQGRPLTVTASSFWQKDSAQGVTLKAGPKAPALPLHYVSGDEMSVYAAYLIETYMKVADDGPQSRQSLIIENESEDIWQANRRAWEAYILKNVSGQGKASDETLRAFLYRLPQKIVFMKMEPSTLPVRMIRTDILREVFDAGGWDAFYVKYPKTSGILTFSAVGWNKKKDEALFTVRTQCGMECGYRSLVFMRMTEDGWMLIFKGALP